MNAFSKHRVAAAIISYHPPLELSKRLQLLQEAGIYVFLWENSPTPPEAEVWANQVLNRGKANAGLGPSLRIMLDLARKEGFEKLLYFDQDTDFTAASLQYMADFLEAGYYTNEFAAIRFGEPQSRDLLLNRAKPQRLLISSGKLFHLGANPRHDRSFFVEGVDYQYCLDAVAKGWKLGVVGCPGIAHESVQPEQVYYVGRFQKAYRKYPRRRNIEITKAYLRLLGRAIVYVQPSYVQRFWRFLVNHWRVQLAVLPFRIMHAAGWARLESR